MVEVVVLGTIGLDDVETPFGKVESVLGGSAAYSAYGCSFFAKPGVVSIIGEDFPSHHLQTLEHKVSLEGVVRHGKTFRWEGLYEYDLNEAKTLRTELNCLTHFKPTLPEKYKEARYVFLGNSDPEVQLFVLSQVKAVEPFVVMDTMNLWIGHKREKLLEVISKVGVLLLNDGEARELFKTPNLVKAANSALALGPGAVIIKKGEHGALLFTRNSHFSAGSYPLEVVKDPTGCGDTFGGGFIGYLAKTKNTGEANMRRAIVYGSALASFNAEDFSLHRLQRTTHEDVEKRFHEFRQMREF